MKKHLLLFSSFTVGIIAANAQITITSADVAVPPKVIMQANDTMPTVTPGSAGAGQTWNMSGLHTHSTDTLNFMPYSWAPNPSFSSANIVVQQGSQPAYSYINNSSTELVSLGIYATVNFGSSAVTLKQINTPAEKLATFPFMYTTSYTNDFVTNTPATYIGTASPPIDSIRQRSVVHKTVVVDAWGSLTTPLGTYNVIRSKETKIKHDTSDVHIGIFGWQNAAQTTADSTTEYTYWANGIGFPLVTLTKDSLGNVSRASWLKAMPTVGINEYEAPVEVNVYPNPAQTEINVMTDAAKAFAIEVYDLTGRIVATQTITSDISTINTSAFANGMYTYTIIGKEKTVLNRGKFSVAK